MILSDVIIDAPQNRNFVLRVRDWILTLLLWTLWVFVCRHVILLIGWLLGVYSGVLQIEAMLELRSMVEPLLLYVQLMMVIALMVVLWAICSRDFFTRSSRRRSFPPGVSSERLEGFFHIPKRDVARCMLAQRIVMHHSDDGLIGRIETELDSAERARSGLDAGAGYSGSGISYDGWSFQRPAEGSEPAWGGQTI